MKTKEKKAKADIPLKTPSKPDWKRLTKYLRELSIVVAGVAITFIVSGWIGRHNEKKELQRNLAAVKTELEENLNTIGEAVEFYEQTGRFAQYLISDEPENLSPDSIAKYRALGIVGTIYTFNYKASAFEIFEKSGNINQIKDKKLLQSILNSYTLLEETKYVSDNYMNRKQDEIFNAVKKNRQVRFDLLAPGFSDLFYFFALYYRLDEQFQECSAQIEETISQI